MQTERGGGYGAQRFGEISMRLCLLNKFGDYKRIEIHFCLRFSAQNTFPQVRYWRQKARKAPMLGKVSLKQCMSLKRGCYGGLVMGHRLGCSRIAGFRAAFQPKQYHAR